MIRDLLCKLGFHKMLPIDGTIKVEGTGKYDLYEYAEGKCSNCGFKHLIRREYFW